MFKKLFQNKDYEISLQGDVLFKGLLINSVDSFIELMISGEKVFFSRTWLGLIAHYEVKVDLKHLSKIKFVKSTSKVIRLKCGNLMQISPPIEVGDGFRLIPGFTNYSIDKNGIVKSVRYNTPLKSRIGPYGYPYVDIYDPDKGDWRSVNVHILLARAFVVNDDPEVKEYVNHKDGIKTNNSLENLEWVSSKQNNAHAVNKGLRKDNKPVFVRDILTGTVKYFNSKTQANKHLGVSSCGELFMVRNGEIIPRLFSKRYEVKLVSDKRDWYHNLSTIDSFEGKDQRQFQCKNIETGIVLEARSFVELSAITGVSISCVKLAVRTPRCLVYNNFIFRKKIEKPWPVIFASTTINKKRAMKVTDLETGDVKIFDSLSETLKSCGLDKRTLKKRLLTGKPYGSLVFEEVHPE